MRVLAELEPASFAEGRLMAGWAGAGTGDVVAGFTANLCAGAPADPGCGRCVSMGMGRNVHTSAPVSAAQASIFHVTRILLRYHIYETSGQHQTCANHFMDYVSQDRPCRLAERLESRT